MTSENPLLVYVKLPPREKTGAHAVDATETARLPSRRHDCEEEEEEDDDSGNSTTKRSIGDGATGSGRTKKRKPTYAARKEEMARLAEEAARLQACVEALCPGLGQNKREDFVATQLETETMEHVWRTQTLAMCGVQSMLGNYLRTQPFDPLHTSIRLGSDMTERQKMLQSMRRTKLDLGWQYLAERFRDVDDHEPFCELQSWTTAHGDFCFRRADILEFEGVHSVQQVFDALLFFFSNMEITISEMLGQLTLREEIDSVDSRIFPHRIVSATDHGVPVEVNAVGFAEYSEKNGDPSALLVTDVVDEDELYPYCPNERVQKNIIGAISMRGFRRATGESDSEDPDAGGELVVAMKRCVFLSMLRPQFAMSKAAREDLRVNIAIWGDVMAQTMREYLHIRA